METRANTTHVQDMCFSARARMRIYARMHAHEAERVAVVGDGDQLFYVDKRPDGSTFNRLVLRWRDEVERVLMGAI